MIREHLLKACRSVKAAEAVVEDGSHDAAMNRAYYAMFNTVRALIAIRNPGFHGRSHASTLGEFSRLYVKTGDLTSDWGQAVNKAQVARHVADYSEEPVPPAEVAGYIQRADQLIAFARKVVPAQDFPELPSKTARESLFEQRQEEAARSALAGTLCALVEQRGETIPRGLEEELAVYATEDDLREMILGVRDMQDLKSLVASRVTLPSLG